MSGEWLQELTNVGQVLLRIDWQLAVVLLALAGAAGYCLRGLWHSLRGWTVPTGSGAGCGACGGCGTSPAQLAHSRAAAGGPPVMGFVELDTLSQSGGDTTPASPRRPAR